MHHKPSHGVILLNFGQISVSSKNADTCLVVLTLEQGHRTVDDDFFLGKDGIVHISLFSPKDERTNDPMNLRQNVIFLLLVDDSIGTFFPHGVQLGLTKRKEHPYTNNAYKIGI